MAGNPANRLQSDITRRAGGLTKPPGGGRANSPAQAKRGPGFGEPLHASPGRGDRNSNRRPLPSPLQGSVPTRFLTPGCASELSQNSIERTFSPLYFGWRLFPGPSPSRFAGSATRLGIERVFGPLDPPGEQKLSELRALKARSISAWGEAPGRTTDNKIKGCKPAPSEVLRHLLRLPGYSLCGLPGRRVWMSYRSTTAAAAELPLAAEPEAAVCQMQS